MCTMSNLNNLSDLDCPQFISFTSPSFYESLSIVQDDRRTPSPLIFKQTQNSPLLQHAENVNLIDKNTDCNGIGDSFLSGLDQSSTTVRNSTLRSPLAELGNSVDSLEDSVQDFTVNKVHHFVTSTDIKHHKPRNFTQFKEYHLNGAIPKETKNYVSLAEQVTAFQKKTPARFHTVGPKQYEAPERWEPPTVNPKSPELRAVKRCRVNTAISQQEQEEKELQEMKNYKFCAKPLNSKVLSKPYVPKKKKRQTTQPIDIKLKTAERAAEHRPLKEETEKYEFHARPVPKTIFAGPSGLKEKVSLPITLPKSPDFALKEREQKWKTMNKDDNLDKVEKFHAHPVPSSTAPFIVKHEPKVTECKPFSFEEKDKERYALKKRKIDKIIEEQSKIPPFKAQALPNVESRFSLPAVRRNRHTELDTTNGVVAFRARPATVLKKPPFVPEKAPVEVPAFKEFQLHTEKRVEEWNKIKERNHLKEIEQEQMLLKRKEEEEEKERQEIKKLRRELVHKANPIRNFKKVEIKHGLIPVTVPKSPDFETKRRLKRDAESSEPGRDSN